VGVLTLALTSVAMHSIPNPQRTTHEAELQGAFPATARFIRDNWIRISAISLAVLAPCLWHRRIAAGDLGSHVYNAWLAQLIHQGAAPGLSIAHPWTNVLFDFELSALAPLFGWTAAQIIAVALGVLIFFWGGFALAFAAGGRPPWHLVPCLAMVTYGWTLEMGFLNYFLALGLSTVGLAILWKGRSWELLIPVALAPLIVLANPLGLAWLLGAAAYIRLYENIPRRFAAAVPLAAVAALLALHRYLWAHYTVVRSGEPLYFFNGADQLLLFGNRYRVPSEAWLGFAAICIGADLILRRREKGLGRKYAAAVQLYLLLAAVIVLLPDQLHLPQFAVGLSLLTPRVTSLSAICLICVLATMHPKKWHLLGFSAIAIVFFIFLYQDTLTLNRMEQQVERLVRTLPPHQRVVGTIPKPMDSRILIDHMLDRACLGWCFSYGNYEPASQAFRIRAEQNNPEVLADGGDAADTQAGEYEVRPEDLPLYQVGFCALHQPDLCIHSLQAGEENGGDQPPDDDTN
jgi:hypothetical protein